MSAAQINITLGTAGHIDHGKTLLIKCLTGCDTDRLKEEKERGMSIELGFAPCTVGGLEVGIVDVPGHESFIKTMVAGAGGMDGVIFVVAADDGVMPQSREHLDILTLLGIQYGLVALTKIDRVEPQALETVREQVRSFVRGTFLAQAPVIPLSSVTGQGFEALLDALAALVRSISPKSTTGVFRLPVERAFALKGHGTVISGIPVSGTARTGDEVVLLPHGLSGRIKAIQVYGRESDAVRAGQCAALNVRHWDHRAIDRGDVVTVPGYFSSQQWCVCRLRLLPHERLILKNAAQVRFHTGTSDVTATLYLLEGQRLEAGTEGLVQFRLSRPIVMGPGDRFIVRTLSPVQTMGGGMIVEAGERRLKRRVPGLAEDMALRADALAGEVSSVEYCTKTAAGLAARPDELRLRAKVPPDRLAAILDGLVADQKVLDLGGGLYMHRDTASAATQRILDAVGDFHRQSPTSPGVAVDSLRQACELDKAVLEGLVRRLLGDGRLVERSHRLALPEHREAWTDEDRALLEKVESLLAGRLFNPPGPQEIAGQAGVPGEKVAWTLTTLREHERIVEVAEGLFFHRQAVDRARDILASHIREHDRLESVDFKYLLDTTRKFAIPLLDYFDRIGVTVRVGYTRYLKGAKGSEG